MSEPLRAVTPTLDGPVLRVLAGAEDEMTRRQITRLVGDASEAGVRKVLRRLAEQGIVLERRIGSQYTYTANREHLMWPAIEVAATAATRLDDRIRGRVADWTFPALSVELVGSAATDTTSVESDIELLVYREHLTVTEHDTWKDQVAALRVDVERWTGNPCEILDVDPVDLVEMATDPDSVLRSSMRLIAGLQLAKATPSATLARRLRALVSSSATDVDEATLRELAPPVAPELRRTINEVFKSANAATPPAIAKAIGSASRE
ncbi:hypothetical protein [Solicola gregarius]|uniref:Uncharacterized protein n=1 Tax=Solicola gregarius TaxID=2908642 RepID=A0AA46TJB4_9ACTN|nr:hypothetical protein [Solicola gregarius]UYM06325.1 hypothetical protein L0C25_04395 [Solicola gregarius]